jgi:hypothetical protein
MQSDHEQAEANPEDPGPQDARSVAQRKRREAEKQAKEFEWQHLADLEEQTDALRQELRALQDERAVTAELKRELERLKNEKLVAASGGQLEEEADTADTNAEPTKRPILSVTRQVAASGPSQPGTCRSNGCDGRKMDGPAARSTVLLVKDQSDPTGRAVTGAVAFSDRQPEHTCRHKPPEKRRLLRPATSPPRMLFR